MRRLFFTLVFMAAMLVCLAQDNSDVTQRVQQLLGQSQSYYHDIDIERALNCATEARQLLDAAGLSHHPLYAEALLCHTQVMTDHDQIVQMMIRCRDIVRDMTDIDRSIDYQLQMARTLGGLSDATPEDYRQALSILDEAVGVLEVLSTQGQHQLAAKYTIPILLIAEEVAFASGDNDGTQNFLNQALEERCASRNDGRDIRGLTDVATLDSLPTGNYRCRQYPSQRFG